MKKTMAITLLCTLLLTWICPCKAEAGETEGTELTVKAPSALLMTVSGQVLWEKDAHTPREPASVTKIMTLLLVCQAIDAGELSLEDTVTASAYAASMGGSQIWMKEGECFTVEQLIKCVVIASANDCAVALGEHLAGSEESFVQKMNRRAEELGMKDTHFVNCCGLSANGHVTSAYDIGLMSACLLKEHPWITDYATIWQDTIRDGAFGLDNTNKLLKSYPGMTGLKTGYTSSAGYCISASALREELHLIAVVLGSNAKEERSRDVCTLLNWGFAEYAAVRFTADQPLMPIPVRMGVQQEAKCLLGEQESMALPRSWLREVRKELILEETLTAPVHQSQQVGELVVYHEEKELCRIPVMAAEEIPRLTLMQIFQRLFSCAAAKKFIRNS